MADFRVYTGPEWDFLSTHPDIIWEGVEPVYYRYTPSVTGVIGIERYSIYNALDLK